MCRPKGEFRVLFSIHAGISNFVSKQKIRQPSSISPVNGGILFIRASVKWCSSHPAPRSSALETSRWNSFLKKLTKPETLINYHRKFNRKFRYSFTLAKLSQAIKLLLRGASKKKISANDKELNPCQRQFTLIWLTVKSCPQAVLRSFHDKFFGFSSSNRVKMKTNSKNHSTKNWMKQEMPPSGSLSGVE